MVYEIRGKIPQNSNYLYSEDVLTGTIFGNLRYFSCQKILIDFLNEAVNLENEKLSIADDNIFLMHFWEKYKAKTTNNYNEPDLVLENDNCVIIIECKYFSVLDEQNEEHDIQPVYKNQLIRYSTIINEYYGNKTEKIIVFLTNEKTKPTEILQNTITRIDKDIKLYWLSWIKLHKCLLNNVNYKKNEKLLNNDLCNFLLKRRLVGFNGFSVNKIDYSRFYQKKYIFNKLFKKITWRYRNE